MKKVNSYILVASLVLLFFSCRVNKPYSRQELHMPKQYRGEGLPLTGDTIQLPFRVFFKDPILVGLIEKALVRNNTITVALKNMQQLELSYKQAKRGLLPVLDLNAAANRTWVSKSSLNGSLTEQFLGTSYIDDYSAIAGLSWEVDIWGKAKMQKEGALANYFAQKENLQALKTRVVVQVAQAYYTLIALDEQLKVAERNVELGDSILAMIRLQYNAGLVSSLAVEQAEAQKKTAQLFIPLAKQNIAMQENAISILCGNYPESIARAGGLAQVTPEEVFPVGVPATLLSRRPDVKAAEFGLISANAGAGLAKAAMYPTLSITPSVGANSFRFNTWFDLPGSLVKNLGVNITQPIFRKRALRTSYEIAFIEQQKAASLFRQSLLMAVGEVSDALRKLQYADERIELGEEKAAALAKAISDATLLYKSAMATYLEVISAQNNALQNELEIIDIKRDKLHAITDLYRALGGSMENE